MKIHIDIYQEEERTVARISHRSLSLLSLAVGSLLIGVISAPAVQADDSPTVCATGCDYSTIQSAVDDAVSGAIIEVGAGTYRERLTIEKSLSLIGIGHSGDQGAGRDAPTINGGTVLGNSPAIITVNTDKVATTAPMITVKISNFNIVGGGSGINVLQNAKMKIYQNTITGFYKNGITFGPYSVPGSGGVSGSISNNVITGMGPTSTVAQNGIQISETNTAAITENQISNGVYTPKDWSTTGILMVEAGNNNTISNNTINTFQNGINFNTQSSGNTISKNKVSNAQYNGIYFWNSVGNNISKNKISGPNPIESGLWGIALDGASTNNTVTDNTITSSDVGIWVGNGSNNNTFTKNTVNHNNIGVQVDTYTYPGSVAPVGVASTGLQFHLNGFTDNGLSFMNTTTELIDAINNWWGSSAGPGALTNITTTPWCTNESCEKKSHKADSESSSHPSGKPSPEVKSTKTAHAADAEN